MSCSSLILVLIFARDQPFEEGNDFAKIQLVGQLCLISFAFAVFASLYVFFSVPSHITAMANIFGIAGALLAVIQYFPQIYTTATLRHAGTLSIPMMCMQTPGGFLWAFSLAQREGTSWSSWLPYFTAASLQGVVLILAVYFERFSKSPSDGTHDSQQSTSTQDNESAPLLN
jgi:uncharacterized protein with PQ loop repeat